MKMVVEALGSLIIALIILGIPITTGLSFGFGWPAFIKYILTVTSLTELIGLWSRIYKEI